MQNNEYNNITHVLYFEFGYSGPVDTNHTI